MVSVFESNGESEDYKSLIRKNFSSILRGITEGDIGFDIINSDYQVKFQNSLLESEFGKYRGELCFDYYLKRKKPCKNCPIMKAVKENRIVIQVIPTPNGRFFRLISIPLKRDDHHITECLNLVEDFTHRKHLEKKLTNLNEVKKNFMNRVSHELKTPLTMIKGNLELLSSAKTKLNFKIMHIISDIRNAYSRLESSVKDILLATELDSKMITVKLKRANLSKILKEIASELSPLAQTRKVNIKLDLHSELKAQFDPFLLKIGFKNIIKNGINNINRERGKILIKSEVSENLITISIKDNGIGFEEDEKRDIFKKFSKIEHYGKGYNISIQGLGLGLYISKEVLNLHDYKLKLHSKGRNQGSTFRIIIPFS
ncbi:MAG: hypothetical protein GF353_21535 [Candidatus Lokiarchaeota archaeon]|nr:hypothetical protein [Candidatus Lokiarchaeota archaeon]